MPQETVPRAVGLLSSILQFLSISVILALLTLLVTYKKLLPNLSISTMEKGHSALAFESRFIIENIGLLPALNVRESVEDLKIGMGAIQSDGGLNIRGSGNLWPRLAAGETHPIPALPRIAASPGMPLDVCEYTLTLDYEAKFFFYTKKLHKRYRIELRNLGNEFDWRWQMVSTDN